MATNPGRQIIVSSKNAELTVRDLIMAPVFSTYEEDERGRIDANGRKLRRIVYRWNGRFYILARGR